MEGSAVQGGAELVEVWMQPGMLRRLKGRGVACQRAFIVDDVDGTYALELRVSAAEARSWDWPVHGPDAERLAHA